MHHHHSGRQGRTPQQKAPSHDASFSRCTSTSDLQRQSDGHFRFLLCGKVLARNTVYPRCFLNMKLMPRRQLTDRFAWHCRDNFRGSRSYHSVRSDSFFGPSRVPLKKAMHLIYLWVQDSSVKAAADTLDVSHQCVQQHFQFMRELCSTHLLANLMSLVRRTDETERPFSKQKSNKRSSAIITGSTMKNELKLLEKKENGDSKRQRMEEKERRQKEKHEHKRKEVAKNHKHRRFSQLATQMWSALHAT